MQRHSSPDPLRDLQELPLEALELLPGTRALIVGDDPLVRGGFVSRLGSLAAGDSKPEDAAQAIGRNRANVVVWDLGPHAADDGTALDGLAELGVPVVALSSENTNLGTLLSRGAKGVLRRDVSTERLRSAVDTVLHGLVVIEPAFAAEALAPASERDAEPDEDTAVTPSAEDRELLTRREHQVLDLLAQGLSNKEIADKLDISTHTAKFHIGAILAKLGSSTRTEAVVRAVQRGLLML